MTAVLSILSSEPGQGTVATVRSPHTPGAALKRLAQSQGQALAKMAKGAAAWRLFPLLPCRATPLPRRAELYVDEVVKIERRPVQFQPEASPIRNIRRAEGE